MSFFGLMKKKKQAPAELPDLISDEIEKESSHELNNFLKEENKTVSVESKEKEMPKTGSVEPVVNGSEDLMKEKEEREEKARNNTNVLNRLIKNVEETPQREMKSESILPRKSFFNDIHKNIREELTDLDSVLDLKKNLANRDVLEDMRDYWKKQKKADVLDLLGRDYQKRISEKIEKLQGLEKEWQVVYFELIEKEEEIKDEEKELKELLNEFAKVCEHKKKSLNEKGFEERRTGENNGKKTKSNKAKKAKK